MNKRIYIILFSFFGLIGSNFGQSKKAFMQAAEEAFAKKNYYSALTFYNEVLQFDEKDANIIYKTAESARQFDSYKLAAERYTYLIDTLQVIPDSSVYYYAGEMYQRLGQFDKATEYYDLYISQYGTEGEYFTEKSKKEKASATWAASRIKEVDPYATVARLDSDVNSEFSDFGAFKFNDDLRDKYKYVGLHKSKFPYQEGECKNQYENCTVTNTVCHYIQPNQMLDLYREGAGTTTPS
jgi:tetratricopeptide (TPR) repeat protein